MIKKTHNIYKTNERNPLIKIKTHIPFPLPDKKKIYREREKKRVYAPAIIDTSLIIKLSH